MVPPPSVPNGPGLRLPPARGIWTQLEVVASTGSTNADLLARAVAGWPGAAGGSGALVAGSGAAEGCVLVAEEQTAGRGRLGRSWTSTPGASLTFSVLLRPAAVPAGRRGWLPLLAGVAVASAVRSAAGAAAVLKWPNDVLVGERKLAGILAEQASDGDAVVIGIGLNVAAPAGALPVSPSGLPATSLLAEGTPASREALLLEILDQLEGRYTRFRADPDPVRAGLLGAYSSLCATLGQAVRVELPAGRVLTGTASGIDPDGRLLVTEEAGRVTPVSAGDVVHLRT